MCRHTNYATESSRIKRDLRPYLIPAWKVILVCVWNSLLESLKIKEVK